MWLEAWNRYEGCGFTLISTVPHFSSLPSLTSWVTMEKLSFTFFLSSGNDHIISPVHYLRFMMTNILMIKMIRTWFSTCFWAVLCRTVSLFLLQYCPGCIYKLFMVWWLKSLHLAKSHPYIHFHTWAHSCGKSLLDKSPASRASDTSFVQKIWQPAMTTWPGHCKTHVVRGVLKKKKKKKGGKNDFFKNLFLHLLSLRCMINQ